VKIGNANTKDLHRNVEVFYIVIAGNRCPVHLFPVAVPGECPRRRRAVVPRRPLPSLMPRLICRWQRVATRPSRTQKLSTCTPTIVAGRLAVKIGNANTEESSKSLALFLCLQVSPGHLRRHVDSLP